MRTHGPTRSGPRPCRPSTPYVRGSTVHYEGARHKHGRLPFTRVDPRHASGLSRTRYKGPPPCVDRPPGVHPHDRGESNGFLPAQDERSPPTTANPRSRTRSRNPSPHLYTTCGFRGQLSTSLPLVGTLKVTPVSLGPGCPTGIRCTPPVVHRVIHPVDNPRNPYTRTTAAAIAAAGIPLPTAETPVATTLTIHTCAMLLVGGRRA